MHAFKMVISRMGFYCIYGWDYAFVFRMTYFKRHRVSFVTFCIHNDENQHFPIVKAQLNDSQLFNPIYTVKANTTCPIGKI
jgi:hypothetical protein